MYYALHIPWKIFPQAFNEWMSYYTMAKSMNEWVIIWWQNQWMNKLSYDGKINCKQLLLRISNIQ